MSAPGRPKREHRSAQHEGNPGSAPGRPKREHRSAQHEGNPGSAPGRPKREHRSAEHEGSPVAGARAPLRLDDALAGETRRADEGQLRRIVLGAEAVDYRLVRARRRSIGMQVGRDGLTVRASRWTTIREIEAVLREHAAWIARRLAERRARRRDVLPEEWKTGAPILFQGRELALDVRPAETPDVAADLLNFTVFHPPGGEERELAAFVVGWLRDEMLRVCTPRVLRCAAQLGLPPPRVALSRSAREWGSCNRRGVIRLSWRLVQLPPELAQYVVAHEVAHLVELNHSARFWAVVETLHPGHRTARRALGEWSGVFD